MEWRVPKLFAQNYYNNLFSKNITSFRIMSGKVCDNGYKYSSKPFNFTVCFFQCQSVELSCAMDGNAKSNGV